MALSTAPGRMGPRAALAMIVVAIFLSMSVWFSASFIIPQLRLLWDLGPTQSALLTVAVQVGFVFGALSVAATGLADRIPGRRLMAWGSILAAIANVLIVVSPSFGWALALRFLTGGALACVYPPALKEISTWYRKGRGKALGLLIAALTMGSAFPHLVNASGGLDWRLVIFSTSVCAALSGALMLLVRESGPYPFPVTNFHLRLALKAFTIRPVVLANVGYVGHMWELYAMWTWIGSFMATLSLSGSLLERQTLASWLAFACIAAGSAGALCGGYLSDRFGRAQSALISLVCSGGAALVLATLGGMLPLVAIIGISIFWGFWVIADSAQFSAMVTEHTDPQFVGSAVALQLAIGFMVTNVTIWLVPVIVEAASWGWALAFLAIGPAAGALAMALFIRERHEERVRV